MSFHKENFLRSHADNGANPMGGMVDTVADNRGRNAFHNIDVGALCIASLRNLNRRYRGRLNVRLLCLDLSQRAGLSSLLDYERAVCNALADLEMQGCIKVMGDLFVGDVPQMNVRVSLTNMI